MNRVGICAASYPDCHIIVFTIMDTHLHIMARGEKEDCVGFVNLYEKLTKYHRRGLSTKLEFTIYEVGDDNEYRRNLAAYIAVQATKDFKNVMFYDYEWSSAPLYFRSGKVIPVWNIDSNGLYTPPVRFGDIPTLERRRILGSRYTIPDNWLVANDIVLPNNYVDVPGFEQIFRTHNAYRVFTSSITSRNDVVQRTMLSVAGTNYEEEEMREICSSVCKELFGKSDVRTLSAQGRIYLAQELRRRYAVGISQLSRRVHLPESELRKYL